MTIRAWTSAILIAVTVGLIGWDIYAVHVGVRNTISRIILDVSERYPIIPFALGVLMGHLLWWQRP